MTDKLNPEQRSELMSRVRSLNTRPEVMLRSLLHKLGYRYVLHRRDLPGKPDIVFPGRRKIIFVHGCYWHGHENCNQGGLSKTNRVFWEDKVAKNRSRDGRVTEELQTSGWEVFVVWGCSLRSRQKISDTIARVTQFLES